MVPEAEAVRQRTDGFEIARETITPEACDELVEIAAPGAGMRGLMRHPVVASLVRREPLMALARRWLGSEAVPYRATLFDKAGTRNWAVAWHQDVTLPLEKRNESTEWGPWSVKSAVLHARAPAWALEKIVALRIHLDASESDNGPLRVVPGSHRKGVLAPGDILAAAKVSVELFAPRGGIIVLRPLLIHASSRSASSRPRRVLHVEYAPSLDLAPGVRLATA
jgi:ectoine hydroxylase-related dioxygenase (phytanoyl-CoA dioxygenase family)